MLFLHLFVGNPAPFLFSTKSIEELMMPLNGDLAVGFGQQPFPCKGHYVGIDGSVGVPVAIWKVGQEVTFQLFDRNNQTGNGMDQTVGAGHSGGSCQVALSFDKGVTWVVIKNFEGNCPRVTPAGQITNHYDLDQDYTFTVPESFPSGERVIFAWTWLNASGSREFCMLCSSINIVGAGPPTKVTPEGNPLLIANLQTLDPAQDEFSGICHTDDGSSVIFPDGFSGIDNVDRAPVALDPKPFQSDALGFCASTNPDTVRRLSAFGIQRRQSDLDGADGDLGSSTISMFQPSSTSLVRTGVTLEDSDGVDVDVELDLSVQDSIISAVAESLSSTSAATVTDTPTNTLTLASSSTALFPISLTSTSLTSTNTFGDTLVSSSTFPTTVLPTTFTTLTSTITTSTSATEVADPAETATLPSIVVARAFRTASRV